MGYVMGLDGGGSKIACLVSDQDGRLLGWGEGGAVNTNYVVTSEAVSSLRGSVAAALHEASLEGERIGVVCISAPISPNALARATQANKFDRIVRVAEGETPRWAARFWIDAHIGITVDARNRRDGARMVEGRTRSGSQRLGYDAWRRREQLLDWCAGDESDPAFL